MRSRNRFSIYAILFLICTLSACRGSHPGALFLSGTLSSKSLDSTQLLKRLEQSFSSGDLVLEKEHVGANSLTALIYERGEYIIRVVVSPTSGLSDEFSISITGHYKSSESLIGADITVIEELRYKYKNVFFDLAEYNEIDPGVFNDFYECIVFIGGVSEPCS